MSDPGASSSGGSPRFDQRKRVNYTSGMLLGVDDFVQDQGYLRARDHLGVRALHGYGTVSGLGVHWDPATGQLRVAAGLAVDPEGRLVCVSTEQCIDLSAWLTEHRDDIVDAAGDEVDELPEELRLHVVLRYRERETDSVLRLSDGDCTVDESRVASRLLDSFELDVVLASSAPTADVTTEARGEAIGRLLELAAADGVDGGEAGVADLRRELVAWTTRRRLDLSDLASVASPADGDGTHPGEPSTAVLLARVDLGLGDEVGVVAPIDPEIDESDRPVLLTTRDLQEWLTGLAAPPERCPSGDHRLLENLDDDDHPQYLRADGSRPLSGTLNAGHNVILNLRRSNGPSHAMRRDEIVGLDLERAADGLRVTALQGEPLRASAEHAPSEGDVLRYDGQRWVPAALPTDISPPSLDLPTPPTSAIRSVLPLVTIERLGRGPAGAAFLLWFGLDAVDVAEHLVPFDGDQPLVYGKNVEIFTELCVDGRTVLRRIASNLVHLAQVGCNVFRADINRQEAEYLRFRFDTRHMHLRSGVAVEAYAASRGIAWVGQSDDGTVTTFVVNPALTRPLLGFEDVETVVAPAGGAEMLQDGR